MGNNLCFENGERQTFPQLLMQKQLGKCQIILTAGPVEKEDVECYVIQTDCSYSNIKPQNRPSFIPQNGQCIFSAANKKQKNQVLAVVDESMITSDKNCEEKQTVYEAVQSALKLADQKQMRSVGFPVFPSIDYATSATIMLLAIKFSLIDQKFSNIKKIAITLDHIGQVNSFKWVFSQVFELENKQMSSYDSTINTQLDTTEIMASIMRKNEKESQSP